MSLRNPTNERYTVEDKAQGKTRKSASSAKPVARAATVVDPPEKTKKQKKAEQKKRAQKLAERHGTVDTNTVYKLDTPEYKRLRRLWWVLLALALAFTAASWIMGTNPNLAEFSFYPLIGAYIAVIAAFYVDFGPTRKLRNKYNYERTGGKSKAARKRQKEHAAQMRAEQKALAEMEAAREAGLLPEEEEEEPKGFFGKIYSRFFKKEKKKTPEVITKTTEDVVQDNELSRKIAQSMDDKRDELVKEIEAASLSAK